MFSMVKDVLLEALVLEDLLDVLVVLFDTLELFVDEPIDLLSSIIEGVFELMLLVELSIGLITLKLFAVQPVSAASVKGIVSSNKNFVFMTELYHI